jgi:putative DNA primase/helicase
MIVPDRLPVEIRTSNRTVLWKVEQRDGKPTKVPYIPSQPAKRASSTDSTTWGSFDLAYAAYMDGKADGAGVVLGDGLIGVDLDHCRDPKTGTITPEASAIITALDSYAEVSPSGCGVHILVHGALPAGGRRKGMVEVYSDKRFFTLTGNHLDWTPTTIEDRTPQLAALHAKLFGPTGNGRERTASRATSTIVSDDDATLVDRARHAKNGDKFTALWMGDTSGHGGDDSAADLALCSHLAFWTGADAGWMDRLFRQSGLMRPKWDRRHGAQSYGRLTIQRALGNCRETYRGPTRTDPAPDPERPANMAANEHLSDMGNARRLVAVHGADLRYCHTWGGWVAWDTRRWLRDDSGEAVRRGKDVVRTIYREASGCTDKDQRTALAKHAARCESESKVRAMLAMAESEPELVIRPEDFDQDLWLLNVQNGTLDLRTATLRPHRREDLITKLAPVVYDADAAAPTWAAFLDRIFDGNADLIAFIQRAIGYSLTANMREQAWFLLHGPGRNGKSTLLRTITDLLGDYATWTPTSTLLAKRGEHVENDLARLRGARMVAAVEAEGGRRLAEALVKQLTGGDAVTARFLYSEYFTFTPVFKLWFGTNHRPEIRGTDLAVWRRIRLVPFVVTIPEAEQDSELPDKLRAEFPGILRWAVEGCLAWQRDGLGWAEAVREATSEYRSSQDIIGEFLAECCVVEQDASVGATDLYRAYVAWCEQAKEHPESQRRFGDTLSERGFTSVRHRGTNRKTRVGVRLVSEQSEPLFRKVSL